MNKLAEINKKICEMRQVLEELIDEKSKLTDPEIIIASQKLDETLNEYNKLLNKVDK